MALNREKYERKIEAGTDVAGSLSVEPLHLTLDEPKTNLKPPTPDNAMYYTSLDLSHLRNASCQNKHSLLAFFVPFCFDMVRISSHVQDISTYIFEWHSMRPAKPHRK